MSSSISVDTFTAPASARDKRSAQHQQHGPQSPTAPASLLSEHLILSPGRGAIDKNFRVKYFSAIRTGHQHLSNRDMFLAIPTNYLDDTHFLQDIPFDRDKDTGLHGSLTNIFSCWNGMVGSGLVFVPWAFSNSGALLGCFLTLIAFAMSFTTQYYVMKAAGTDTDFTETLKKTFGKKGWVVGMALFIFMLSIPIILYFQLLSQLLYPIILLFIELATGEERTIDLSVNFTEFSYSYTCILVFVILFAVTAKKDLAIFIRINTFGVIFTIVIIIFIVSVGVYGLSTQRYEFVASHSDAPVDTD